MNSVIMCNNSSELDNMYNMLKILYNENLTKNIGIINYTFPASIFVHNNFFKYMRKMYILTRL